MEQGHYEEAEGVYRDDLGLSNRISAPPSIPTMSGAARLVECLQRRGETKELPGFEAKLAGSLAKVDADHPSRMCRTKVHQPASQSKDCCSS